MLPCSTLAAVVGATKLRKRRGVEPLRVPFRVLLRATVGVLQVFMTVVYRECCRAPEKGGCKVV